MKGKVFFSETSSSGYLPFLNIGKAKLIPPAMKVLGGNIAETENFACDTWFEGRIWVFVVMT